MFKSARSKRSHRRSTSNRRRLNLEQLEARRLLAGDVAILGADDSYWLSDVEAKVESTGLFSNVDTINLRFSTPTLKQLENYDSVLVYSNWSFQDPTTLGNNLADYVDAGHGVVVSTFANASVPLLGRWSSDGYDVINPAGQSQFTLLTLADVAQPGHPIMSGVTDFSGGPGSYHGVGGLTTGSALIASWSNGRPLVAETDAFAGRNVSLNFFPPSSDVFFDGWTSSTDGALLMGNALKYAMGGLRVSSIDPANGSVVSASPTQYVVNVSDPLDAATLDAADLEVNGNPASSVAYTAGSTSVTFTFDTDPVTTQGLQTMHVAADAFTSAADAEGVEEFNGTFRYDALLMDVISTAPAEGSTVLLPFTTLDLDFNEAYDVSSAEPGDFVISQGTLSAISQVDADTLRLTLDGIENEGTLVVELDAGAMTDVFGNPGAAFSASYTLDFGVFPYPVPLTPKEPLGSLIYDPTKFGIINPAGDTDSFTIQVDSGQLLTLVVDSDASLRSTVEVHNQDGELLGSATAGAAGESVVLQNIPTHGQLGHIGPSSKTYTITMGGADGTTGGYNLQLILNAAVEEESQGGPSTSNLATAQSLESAFLPLHGSVVDADEGRPERAAVLGEVGQALYSVSRVSNQLYTIDSGTGRILNQRTLTLPGGWVGGYNRGLAVDPTSGTLYGLLQTSLATDTLVTIDPATAVVTSVGAMNTSGQVFGEIVFDADGNLYGVTGGSGASPSTLFSIDKTNPATQTALFTFSSVGAGGVALNPDDGLLYRYQRGLFESIDVSTTPPTVTTIPGSGDLPFVGQGMVYAGGGQFLLSGNGNAFYTIDTSGAGNFLGYHNFGRPHGLALVGGDSIDVYSFDLTAGESATVALTAQANMELAIFGPTGAQLALGSGAENVSEVISNLAATTTGTYYARITTGSLGDYSLLVTRNADFDAENNDTIATAQDLLSSEVAGRQWALGHVDAEYVTLQAIDSGWYNSDGLHDANNTNWVVGERGDATEFRNFFVFDLSSFGRNVGSAELELYNPPPPGYDSVDAMETYTLFDVSTAIPTLTAGGTGQLATFDDLGSGNTLASRNIASSNGNQLISIDLNADGLTYLNAANGGQVALGGAVTTLSGSERQMIFRRTGFQTRQLTVGTSKSDFYKIDVDENTTVEIQTRTPARTEGQFVNNLNPMVRLYDADGNLVASDDNSDPDGHNARLRYRVPRGSAGAYYVEVTASDATELTTGEYTLSVKGASGELPAFQATDTSIADGVRRRGPTTQLTVDFNDTILLTSLEASDLTVNGAPAIGFTIVDGETVTFDLPTLSEGVQDVQLAGGAVVDVQNTPIDAFSLTFYHDLTPPQIVASSITEGEVIAITGLTSDLTYTVEFSEPMNAANLDNSDLSLLGVFGNIIYTPTTASFDATGTVLTLNYENLPEDAYTLSLLSGNGRFEDTAQPNGWNLDGEYTGTLPSGDGVEGGNFVLNFALLDDTTAAYPTPFNPLTPAGSLIYDQSADGIVQFDGDTDSFTVSLDAGQTISVVVDPLSGSGLRPNIELRDLTNAVVGTATAGGEGQDAVIQTVATVAGMYTFIVGGDGGTTGRYSLQLTLNAALESESHDGASNDTLQTAQDIEGSFVDLLKGADRGAVLGQTAVIGGTISEVEPNDNFAGAQDIDGGPWNVGFDAYIFNSTTRPHVSIQGTGNNTFDYYSFTVANAGDTAIFDIDLTSGLDAWLDLYTSSGVLLRTSDDNGNDPGSFTGLDSLINYTFAAPGTYVVRVGSYPRQPVYNGTAYTLQVSLENHPFSPPTGPDTYSFGLEDGQYVEIAATSLSDGNVDITLLDGAGNTISSGINAGTNTSEVIRFTGGGGGTYYIQVTGDSAINYSLVVTRDAVFDREANDSFDTAQNFDGVVGSLGHVQTVNTAMNHSAGFSDPSDLTANGSTTFTGDLVRLTSGGFGQTGSVFSNERVNVSTFSSTFTFRLYPGTWNMADGITFTIQGNSPTALGGAGGDLGYAGISNSVAVKFDIYNNLGEGTNSTGLYTGGSKPMNPSISLWGTGINLRSQNVHRVDMVYNGSVLQVTITDTETAATSVQSYTVDIPALVGGETAFVGFTGATGGLTTVADIQTWEFTEGSDEDWYSVTLDAGTAYSFPIITPGDGPGEFVNTLDPKIEFFDPDGNLLDSDDGVMKIIDADGRNETLEFTPSTSGLYRIRVTAENGTAGEYFLDPAKLPALNPPAALAAAAVNSPLIVGSQPANNASRRRDDETPRRQDRRIDFDVLNAVILSEFAIGAKSAAVPIGSRSAHSPSGGFTGSQRDQALASVDRLFAELQEGLLDDLLSIACPGRLT